MMLFFFLMYRRPHISTLFPYTTLFRSRNRRRLKANQTGKKFRVGIKSNNVYVGFMVWSNFTATKCRDRKSGSAGMPRPISYAVFCLKKKKKNNHHDSSHLRTPPYADR